MLQGGSCGQPPQRPPLWDLQPLENGCFGQQWGPGSSLATAADSHPLPALSSSRASSSHSPCQQTWFNEKTNSHPQSAPRPAVPRTASPIVPSPGLHGRLSGKERAHSSPKVETRFLPGRLCNCFVVESTAVLQVFWKKKNR